MTTHLYLVRHGETDWNKTGRIQGQQNPPLNELGRRQAKAAGDYLAQLRLGYDCFYCSDLQRAQETAEIIAARWKAPVIPRCDLREQCFGVVEGCQAEEALDKHKVDIRAYLRDPLGKTIPGGESLDEMGERGLRFMAYLRENHRDQSVVVVSHGGLVKTFLTLILGMPVHLRNRLEIGNAAVSVVRLAEGGDKVIALNANHHLAQVL